jgi:hypothetical protein
MLSIVRNATVVAFVAVLALPGAVAAAGVGVTSATDGDPLGRPPAAAERVLHVGIDIEASERVTTGPQDRAHVVFLDGTSITIGPNSVLTIDKFVFDPNVGKGDMGVTLTKGVFRLVGGKISKNSEITIGTPSATIGIRGGIVAVAVDAAGNTTADFLHGDVMRATAQGVTQTATRTGSQIEVASTRPPSAPHLLPLGGLSSVTKMLEKSGTTASGGGSTSIRQALADPKLLNSPEGQARYAKTVHKDPTYMAYLGRTPRILGLSRAPIKHILADQSRKRGPRPR